MTIAIGINLGLYALLAADTRVTYEIFGTQFHRDDKTKVHKTQMGLITGAGFVQLLDSITKRLEVEQIKNTNVLISIIKEEYEVIRNKCGTYSQPESWIAQTGWIFSYTTLINNENILRVGIFHPRMNKEEHGIYEIGRPAIILPIEIDSNASETILDSITRKIVIPKDSSEIQSSIDQNVAAIAVVISALQPFFASISKRFQVGIHCGGSTGISDIIDIQDNKVNSFNINIGGI